MSYDVIVLAAGKGSRFSDDENKLLYKLKDGTAVIVKTLRTFLNDDLCDRVVLVASEEIVEEYRKFNAFYGKLVITFGGERRQDSVYSGILACTPGKVLIHDGARPWVNIEDIHRVVDALNDNEAVCLTAKMTDTVKEVKGDKIVDTLDRDTLRRAQTPQGFDYDAIKEAYKKSIEAGWDCTDDAQLYQKATGKEVKFIDALYPNEKITVYTDVENK